MNKKDTTYRMPEGFNPHPTVDTIRALTHAIHYLVTEGDMTERPAPKYALASLQSLLELLQPEVRALQEYLREIENRTTLNLPLSDEEFEAVSVETNRVKEPPAIYRVS